MRAVSIHLCKFHPSWLFQLLYACNVQSCLLVMARVALALWLIHALGKTWVVEQPASSIAGRHPRFRALLRCMRIWRIHFWLCKFGSKSPKRLKLWSNSRGIRFFGTSVLTKKQRERLPHRLAKTKVRADGKKPTPVTRLC